MTLSSVFVDFDGTISLTDSTDDLLTRFANPVWLDIEAAWLRGEIGSRTCLARQVAYLDVLPAALDDFAADVAIDPDFPAFVALCEEAGLPVTVLSDGLDRVVRGALRAAGLGSLPVIANRIVPRGGARWALEFPHGDPGCRAQSGNCKCATLRRATGTIMIGDGRSDFCAAGTAGRVLAKSKLLRHCRDQGIACHPFASFADAMGILAALIAAPSAAPMREEAFAVGVVR